MFAGAGVHDLDLPAPRFRVLRIHAEQVAGKYRRLVTAGRRADFQIDIAVVVGIPGDQLQPDLRFDDLEFDFCAREFFLAQAAQFRIAVVEHVQCCCLVSLGLAPGPEQADHGRDLRIFPGQVTEAGLVAEYLRVGQQPAQLFGAGGKFLEFSDDGGLHYGYYLWCEASR